MQIYQLFNCILLFLSIVYQMGNCHCPLAECWGSCPKLNSCSNHLLRTHFYFPLLFIYIRRIILNSNVQFKEFIRCVCNAKIGCTFFLPFILQIPIQTMLQKAIKPKSQKDSFVFLAFWLFILLIIYLIDYLTLFIIRHSFPLIPYRSEVTFYQVP